MNIGIVGSSNIGGAVARLFVKAGHEVAMSNSRGPETLGDFVAELCEQAHAMTIEDAAHFWRSSRICAGCAIGRCCSVGGWAAALCRSELVALEVADLSFEPEGVVLTIRRSKTDREGAGATVAIPLGAEDGSCPVLALRRWLAAAAIGTGARLSPDRSAWASRADLLGSGARRDRGGPRRRCRTRG
jgi:NAD(P)-dependent dehydrogenase (short-subunit alcohol dehydrogenase family)